MKDQPLISLLVIVCNDADRLPACVFSARNVVDEVVIVVQDSTDNTLEVTESLPVDRIIRHDCRGYQEASRDDAIPQCSGRWILQLDADEVLTPWAADRIRVWCENPDHHLFLLRRLTTVGGMRIEDSPHPRLVRIGSVTWGSKLHSVYYPKSGIPTITIVEEVCILQNKSIEEQELDNKRYALLGSR